MKKFWKITAMTLALTFSFVGMTGCENKVGDGGTADEPSGKISGNYKEVSDETLATQLAKVESAQSGENSATATGNGLKVEWLLDVSAAYAKANASVKSTGDIHAYVGGTEGAPEIAAKLTTKNSAKIYKEFLALTGETSKELKDVSATANLDCYLDNTYLYAGVDAKLSGLEGVVPENTPTSFDGKVKISTEEIMDFIGGLMSGTLTTTEEDTATSELLETITSLKQTFAIAVTADVSDGGFKMKLSTTEETAAKIEAFIAGLSVGGQIDIDPSLVMVLSMADLTKCSAEMYAQFDANGKFVGAAASIDLGVSVFIPTGASTTEKLTVGMKFKGGVYSSTDKVTLPEGIATDTTYEEKKLSDLDFM